MPGRPAARATRQTCCGDTRLRNRPARAAWPRFHRESAAFPPRGGCVADSRWIAVREHAVAVAPFWGLRSSRGRALTGREITRRARRSRARRPEPSQRAFAAVLRAAELPAHFTPHCLRHSFASLLLSDGVSPADARAQLDQADGGSLRAVAPDRQQGGGRSAGRRDAERRGSRGGSKWPGTGPSPEAGATTRYPRVRQSEGSHSTSEFPIGSSVEA